jgi:anti-anti-sigma regulatory factor
MGTTHSDQSVFIQQHDCLVVPLRKAHGDRELTALCVRIAHELCGQQPRKVVLDLSGLDVMDSFCTRNLQDLCHILHAYTMNIAVIGIPREIVASMTTRGLGFKGITIAFNLQEALAHLGQKRSS